MLRKILIILFSGLVLVGCSEDKYNEDVSISKPQGSVVDEEEIETNASEIASELVTDLDLDDTLNAPLGMEVIPSIFLVDEDFISDGCAYLSNGSGDADTIAVFKTKNTKEVKKILEEYVDSVKSNTELYYDQEYKFENAIIDSNKTTVILVVCEDAKTAKKAVENILK